MKDYKFVKVPINLFYLMDGNCRNVMFTLIQMGDYYPKNEGYFECAYECLMLATGLSQNVVKATLDALYQEGLIDVKSVGKGKGKSTNKYKINDEKFQEYENTPVGIAIMTKDKPIHTLDYKNHYSPSFSGNQTGKEIGKEIGKKVTTNIPNITNIENKDNIDNITNIDNKEIKELNNLSIDIPSIEHRDPNRPGLGQVYLDDDLIRGLSDIERSIQLEYYYTLRDITKLEMQRLDFNDTYYLPQTLDWLEKRNIHQLEQYMLYWNDGGRVKLSQEMEGLTPAERKDIIIYLVLYCKADDTRCSENIYQPVYAA